MKGKAFILLLIALLLFTACSRGDDPGNPSQPTIPDSTEQPSTPDGTKPENVLTDILVSLSKTEFYVGEEVLMTIQLQPSSASDNYIISVADESIASRSGNKLVGLKPGTTKLTVSSEDTKIVKEVEITVLERLTNVSQNAFLNSIREDVYTRPIVTDSFGSFSASNNGIIKDDFLYEVKYPVPEDGIVYNASDYNITSNNKTNAENLRNLLTSLEDVEGTKIIKFSEPVYYFSQSIVGSNLEDVYFVGENNTKFIYTGWLTYFKITSSKNIHINNITFDMDPSPTISGNVHSVVYEDSTKATIAIDVDDNFDMTNPAYANWKSTMSGSYAEYIYDSKYKTYVPDNNANLFYSNGVASGTSGILDIVYSQSDKLLHITLSKKFGACAYKTPEIGKRVAIGFKVYESAGFLFTECEDTYMESVTTYVAAGMGLRTNLGKNLYLNRVHFVRDNATNRLLTCTADILHTAALKGELIISNSYLEGSHDDAINVKTFYTKIDSVRSEVIEVVQTQSEVIIGFEVGDEIDIINPTGFAPVARRKIVAITKIGTVYQLTLDEKVSIRYKGFLVGNHTQATRMTLENTLIANKRNRGILLQGRESVIKNCTFQNVTMGAIQVLAVADSFNEAIAPQNIVIENTKFLQCNSPLRVFSYDGSQQSTIGAIRDVELLNNYFYSCYGNEIYLLGVENATIKNNLFDCFSNKTVISVNTSGNVAVENNCTVSASGISTKFLYVDENSINVTEKNNK
ncbi:MAG: right-handed parallel beta-helix repeat-containing protein [Ruminococcaceae bacterium]|nr:right-handed parallel beta-helix repeat-containing protein [Oscillospiraceae bacterium]